MTQVSISLILAVIWIIIILSYAFKMRQDYLSTSYLDQKYLPSERSETREIWIDPSNVCWDNHVSFWRHMMIFFSHLSLFNRWNILENMRKLVKVEHGCPPLSLACVVRSHHVDYRLRASNVDVTFSGGGGGGAALGLGVPVQYACAPIHTITYVK